MSSTITVPDFRVPTIVLPIISYLATTFRLYDRLKRSKFWWDDGWALVSMLFTIVFQAGLLIHISNPESMSRTTKIAVYYICALFFYAVVWSARVSILFTVIRISPTGRLRTFLGYVVIATGTTFIILFCQVWWVCEREPGWKDELMPQCFLGQNVAIAQVITDVFMDAILIFTPVRLIWKVRLSKGRKMQLIAVFSTTVVTTIVSLFHAFAVLRKGGLYEALAAVIESTISLLVANLTVIIACIFRATTEDAEINNRDPVYTHSQSKKRRNRADPLRTLTTFDDSIGTTLGSGGILTTVQMSRFVDGSRTTEGTDDIKVKARDFLEHDSVKTFELKAVEESNQSQTIIAK